MSPFYPIRLARRSLAIGAGFVAVAASFADRAEPSLAAAMHAAALQDFPTAHRTLLELERRGEGDSRDFRFCLASVLLSAPPKTEARVQEARNLFASIAEANPLDDLGLAARFYLARIEQNHRANPDIAAATALYSALAADAPTHWFGQFALIKLAMIDLYAEWPEEPLDARVAAWMDRAHTVTDPALRRNLCWMLGDIQVRLGGNLERALAIYQEGEAIGYSRWDIRSLMILRIHNLARDLGHTALAREAAQRHIDEFPRSTFTTLLRERIAEIDATAVVAGIDGIAREARP